MTQKASCHLRNNSNQETLNELDLLLFRFTYGILILVEFIVKLISAKALTFTHKHLFSDLTDSDGIDHYEFVGKSLQLDDQHPQVSEMSV